MAVEVIDRPKRDRRLFVRDLSSLQYDRGTGRLLALSTSRGWSSRSTPVAGR